MNDSARITSFDQLSSLKIDVMPNPAQDTTAQVSAERPTKKQNFQPRTQQQQQPQARPQRPMAVKQAHAGNGYNPGFRNEPVNNQNFQQPRDVQDIVQVIKQRTRVNEPAPTKMPELEDFIMMLQEHIFSFTMHHQTQLPKFIKAQAREKALHEIAWAGGDEYMTALMLHQETAVKGIVEKAIQKHMYFLERNARYQQQRQQANHETEQQTSSEETATDESSDESSMSHATNAN